MADKNELAALALVAGNVPGALRLYQQVLQESPNNPTAMFQSRICRCLLINRSDESQPNRASAASRSAVKPAVDGSRVGQQPGDAPAAAPVPPACNGHDRAPAIGAGGGVEPQQLADLPADLSVDALISALLVSQRFVEAYVILQRLADAVDLAGIRRMLPDFSPFIGEDDVREFQRCFLRDKQVVARLYRERRGYPITIAVLMYEALVVLSHHGPQQIQRMATEIQFLLYAGVDTADSARCYQIGGLGGTFSGLELSVYLYAAGQFVDCPSCPGCSPAAPSDDAAYCAAFNDAMEAFFFL